MINLAMLFVGRPDLFDAVASKSPVSLDRLGNLFEAIRGRLPNGAASMLWVYKWLVTAHVGEASLMAVYAWYRGARGLTWVRHAARRASQEGSAELLPLLSAQLTAQMGSHTPHRRIHHLYQLPQGEPDRA